MCFHSDSFFFLHLSEVVTGWSSGWPVLTKQMQMHPRHVDSIFNELGFKLKSSKKKENEGLYPAGKDWLMEIEK